LKALTALTSPGGFHPNFINLKGEVNFSGEETSQQLGVFILKNLSSYRSFNNSSIYSPRVHKLVAKTHLPRTPFVFAFTSTSISDTSAVLHPHIINASYYKLVRTTPLRLIIPWHNYTWKGPCSGGN
jgi:hypothetical protein